MQLQLFDWQAYEFDLLCFFKWCLCVFSHVSREKAEVWHLLCNTCHLGLKIAFPCLGLGCSSNSWAVVSIFEGLGLLSWGQQVHITEYPGTRHLCKSQAMAGRHSWPWEDSWRCRFGHFSISRGFTWQLATNSTWKTLQNVCISFTSSLLEPQVKIPKSPPKVTFPEKPSFVKTILKV